MIHVIATVTVVPGRRDDFLEKFRAVVPLVRAESGCLDYGPTVDLPTTIAAQPPERGDTVTVVERWADMASLEAHLVAPHMIAYRTTVADLVSSVQIHVLKPV